jgi:rRNA maturation protein Nop10
LAYFDITCLHCGPYHTSIPATPRTCLYCGSDQIIVAPHDYDIDRRFKEERKNMLDRMDIE